MEIVPKGTPSSVSVLSSAASASPSSSWVDAMALGMGLPALSRKGFDKTATSASLFHKFRASATVFVDAAVGAGDLPALEGALKARSSAVAPGADFLSSVVSLWTGVAPAVHGVPAAAWADRSSSKLHYAYESFCPAVAASRVANLLDVAEVSAGHRGLVVAVANEPALARAVAPRPEFARRTASSGGLLAAAYWSGDAFVPSYPRASAPVAAAAAKEGAAALLRASSAAAARDLLASSALASFATGGNVRSVTVRGTAVDVVLADGSAADFSLGTEAFRGFYSELAAMMRVAEYVGSRAGRALVLDSRPDFFVFAVSLEALRQQYAGSAAHERAALAMVDAAAARLHGALAAAYGADRVLFQAAALPPRAPLAASQATLAAFSAKLAGVAAAPEAVGHLLPLVYLRADATREERSAACAAARTAFPNAVVSCRPDAPATVAEAAKLQAAVRAAAASHPLGDVSADESAIFQVVIWTTVALILLASMAVYPMFFVHELRDEVLFSIDFDEQRIFGPKLN